MKIIVKTIHNDKNHNIEKLFTFYTIKNENFP